MNFFCPHSGHFFKLQGPINFAYIFLTYSAQDKQYRRPPSESHRQVLPGPHSQHPVEKKSLQAELCPPRDVFCTLAYFSLVIIYHTLTPFPLDVFCTLAYFPLVIMFPSNLIL
jgi:hypothetical protein